MYQFKIKLISFTILLIQFGLHDIYSQLNDSILDAINSKINLNQHAPYSEKPGKYQQIINASKTLVAPGDTLEINYFISGYGKIDNRTAKVYYSFSADIIDSQKSILKGSFKTFKNDRIGWGGAEYPLTNGGATLMLTPMIFNEYSNHTTTLFDDSPPKWIKPIGKKSNNYNYPSPFIYLEQRYDDLDSGEKGLPPFKWKIKLLDNTIPGDYYFSFLMTYYNGDRWQNEKSEIKITVIPWYEEHESIIQWAASIIAVLTIITLTKPALKELQTLCSGTLSFSKSILRRLRKLKKQFSK